MASHTKPSDLELQVLAVLWDRGPSTARAVLAALPDGKDRAYTTVLSVMQMMEKKGLLSHEREGNANRYRPRQRREQILKPFMRRVVGQVFGGSRVSLVESLLGSERPDAEELAALRALIARYEQEV